MYHYIAYKLNEEMQRLESQISDIKQDKNEAKKVLSVDCYIDIY